MGGYFNLTGKILAGSAAVWAAGKLAEKYVASREESLTATEAQAMMQNVSQHHYELLECYIPQGRKFWERKCDEYDVPSNKTLREALWQVMNDK